MGSESLLYFVGIVYNTFPLPPLREKELERIASHADAVLAARANHPAATQADLYDSDLMSFTLRKAHQALDCAMDCSIDAQVLLSNARG